MTQSTPPDASRRRSRLGALIGTATAAFTVAALAAPADASPAAYTTARAAGAHDVARTAAVGSALTGAAHGTPTFVAEHQRAAVAKIAGVPASQLVTKVVRADRTGADVTYQQTAAGVPIHGAAVVASLDRLGRVIAVNGRTSGLRPSAARAHTSTTSARTSGLKHVAARYHRSTAALVATGSRLEWYDPALARTGTGVGQLVYTVHVLPRTGGVHGDVMVSAGTNGVVADETVDGNDINRAVCDVANQDIQGATVCNYGNSDRVEGGGASGIADVDSAYDQFGSASSFYSGQLGVDLTSLIGYNDGTRTYLSAITRACDSTVEPDCPMQNAFWNGYGMAFGQGFTGADDVITHELTHGVTQNVNNLQYGAMNEAMSDVMGEFEDQSDGTGNDSASVKWLVGEDLPASIGAIRNMADPPSSAESGPHPDRIGSPDFNPNGEAHGMSGPMSKTAYLISDGGSFNGYTITGIGLAKSVQLWWKVEKTLTSYSQYKSLNTTLASACSSLQSAGTLTASDCQQVTNAKAATELPLATQ